MTENLEHDKDYSKVIKENPSDDDSNTATTTSRLTRLELRVAEIAKKQKPLPPRYKRRMTWPEAYFYSVCLIVIAAVVIALIFGYVV